VSHKEESPPPLRRLDPDRAVEQAGGPRRPEPVIDTRRYQWTIGGLGIILVIAFSLYLFLRNGVTTPGIAAGRPIFKFVAPLATSGLKGDANMRPRCDPSAPNPRALNVCGRGSMVLAFFVTGSGSCKREVDTLQRISTGFPGVQFAAVAVGSNRSDALSAVRAHQWTIPVAYDADDAIGRIYDVAFCPMIELVRGDGRVAARLFGEDWIHPAKLAARVRAELG
jgi:hypothetical protein